MRRLGYMLACAVSLAAPLLVSEARVVQAQQLGVPQTPVLTIVSDDLFAKSAFGQRVAAELEAESAILAAENSRIEAELSAEELELTERRPAMEVTEFRALADAFDQKVRETRQVQLSKARALTQKADLARGEFWEFALPVLETMMRDAGASVVLERSSVILSSGSTDITDLAISRIDAALGDGGSSLQD